MPPAPQTDKRGIDFGANFDGTSKETVNKQDTSQAEDSGKKNSGESAEIVTPVTISIAKAIDDALENQKAPPPNPHDLDSTIRTYDKLWETLSGLEMLFGNAEGYCAWLKGDMLNWIKPLPGRLSRP